MISTTPRQKLYRQRISRPKQVNHGTVAINSQYLNPVSLTVTRPHTVIHSELQLHSTNVARLIRMSGLYSDLLSHDAQDAPLLLWRPGLSRALVKCGLQSPRSFRGDSRSLTIQLPSRTSGAPVVRIPLAEGISCARAVCSFPED